jgi:hypothetical protein
VSFVVFVLSSLVELWFLCLWFGLVGFNCDTRT